MKNIFFFIETGIIWYTVIEIMCLVENNLNCVIIVLVLGQFTAISVKTKPPEANAKNSTLVKLNAP